VLVLKGGRLELKLYTEVFEDNLYTCNAGIRTIRKNCNDGCSLVLSFNETTRVCVPLPIGVFAMFWYSCMVGLQYFIVYTVVLQQQCNNAT